jgi:N4-gp56 family major capsid protein
LTEGAPPDAVGVTINFFEAVTEQYGQVVKLSDLAELTARHNIVERTIYMLGLQAAETYDQLVFNVLDAASTTYYPNGKTGDTGLTASDLVGYPDLVELDASLNDAGARPFEGGEYVYINPPQIYGSILKDPDFKASNQFKAPEKLWEASGLSARTPLASLRFPSPPPARRIRFIPRLPLGALPTS